MDITTLTITELQALGYQQVKLLNATQQNLTLIEQEIAKRSAEPIKTEEPKDETDATA